MLDTNDTWRYNIITVKPKMLSYSHRSISHFNDFGEFIMMTEKQIFCGFFDSVEFFFVVIKRKIYPTCIIIACTCFIVKHIMSCCYLFFETAYFVLT